MANGKKRGSRGHLSQAQIEARYEWVWQFHKDNGVMPSYSEMAEGWGITTGVVRHTLKRFHDLGWVVREFRKQRGIQLLRALD